jgi:N-methylhydantoinase B
VFRPGQETLSFGFGSGIVVEPGDEIVIATANGGGWGAPKGA